MKLLDSLPQDKLTLQAEAALGTKIQKVQPRERDAEPCISIVNDLVLHTMHEAFLYAKRVCRAKIPDDELFSLCYLALRRNAKRFRPGQVRFFAFAKPGIRGALSRHWKTLDVVKNSSMHETDTEAITPNLFSVSSTGDTDRDDTDWTAILVTGSRHGGVSLEEFVEADFGSIDIRERMGIVTEIIKRKLTEQEQMILNLVYKSGFNFQEIGNLLELTRSAAQLSHAKSLKKIRGELARTKQLLPS